MNKDKVISMRFKEKKYSKEKSPRPFLSSLVVQMVRTVAVLRNRRCRRNGSRDMKCIYCFDIEMGM